MSRDSRIIYQPGGIFVMVRVELVTLLGFSHAAILGYLDFIDRGRQSEGEPLATRARIIADLQGILGKNKVDEALGDLVGRGWVKKIERREVRANIMQWFEFSLLPENINDDLAAARRDGRLPEIGTPALTISGSLQVSELGPAQVLKKASPIKKDLHPEKNTQSTGVCDDFFGKLWESYPRQTGRKSAEVAFSKLFPGGPTVEETQAILAGLSRWRNSHQWRNGTRWVAGLDRFLREGMYLETPSRGGGYMHTPIPAGNESPGGGRGKLRLTVI
jgi:hypothetical protein